MIMDSLVTSRLRIMDSRPDHYRRSWLYRGWVTLSLGVGLILASETLLFLDVSSRGWLVIPTPDRQPLPLPSGELGTVARWVAINMTVLCWIGYLLTADGALTVLASKQNDVAISSIRARPNRFVVAWLTSIPVWCFFDWINFAFMDAWRYHGLPDSQAQRYTGYFLAFAAISPGMFMAGQLYQHLGMRHWRTEGVHINKFIEVGCLLLGALFLGFPFLIRDPIGNLTLWVSLMFLLDPINHWLGVPSIIGDWKAGRWGRTVSLMAGGATCGLCWEFWNYWAIAKWTYHLPFLGDWQQYKYFEMPWLGFLGFLPFAIECWVVLNTTLFIFEAVGLRLAERLPDDDMVM